MPDSVIELRQVSLRYGDLTAVQEVSLSVPPGQVVTVVGESGCGKSSLGKLVLGVERPTSGSVLYQGQELWGPGFGWTPELRRTVQVVHQDSYASLNPVRRIRSILGDPLRQHRVKTTVEELLASVGLDPPEYFASKYPFQLSGGQRQRVSLARATIASPRLIVADEPVSGVDASLRLAILDLMRRLAEERGIAFLYITHDLATARYLARGGRMLVMYLGRVVEQGPVEAVLDDPHHPYLQALLAALPARERRPLPLRSLDLPDPRRPPGGCAFHPRCPRWQKRCEEEAPALGERVACHFPGRDPT